MEKGAIVEVLADWNLWRKQVFTGVSRPEYLARFDRAVASGQVVVGTGVRRSGKSTLFRQYMTALVDRGTPKNDILYVNLEEPRFMDELSPAFLQRVFESYVEIVSPAGKPYVFLDEVQNVDGWEKFVRAIHERREAVVFVTGSSSQLLSSEFGSRLTGRHVDIAVYPLEFREFLAFRNVSAGSRFDVVAQGLEIRRLLREYLSFGGFPLVALSDEKGAILAAYFDDIVIKDVAVRHGIGKVGKLRSLAKYYLTNASALSSYRNIRNVTGLNLNTIERFSGYLREAYLVFGVPKFARSIKEQEVNPRKYYAIDPGLRNIVSLRFGDDLGKLYENVVFLKLAREAGEVFYHKGRKECDFVVKRGDRVEEAIQVCSALNDSNRAREIEGIVEAMTLCKIKNGTIVTDELDATEEHGGHKITFVPLWKWLLE